MHDGKWIGDLKPDMPLAEAARLVLSARLGVVGRCLAPALQHAAEDVEHIHRLRVATRRARAALDIFADCLSQDAYREGRKQLRRIRRAAGAARDWDVFRLTLLDSKRRWPARAAAGRDLLTGYALAQRGQAQQELSELGDDYVDRFERVAANVLGGITIKRPSASLAQRAAELLQELVQKVDNALAGELEDYAKLHQVRIDGKRLRYAMEIFAACYPPAFRTRQYSVVEDMQEILGLANDSHVALGHLRDVRLLLDHMPPASQRRCLPGIELLQTYHEEKMAKQRLAFARWRRRWTRLDLDAVVKASQDAKV